MSISTSYQHFLILSEYTYYFLHVFGGLPDNHYALNAVAAWVWYMTAGTIATQFPRQERMDYLSTEKRFDLEGACVMFVCG